MNRNYEQSHGSEEDKTPQYNSLRDAYEQVLGIGVRRDYREHPDLERYE